MISALKSTHIGSYTENRKQTPPKSISLRKSQSTKSGWVNILRLEGECAKVLGQERTKGKSILFPW